MPSVMPKELPWGVELVVQDVVDVMVPQNPQKPDQVEIQVLVAINWANHGTNEHEIRQWPVEFHSPGLPATTMATFRRPLLAHPTNAGIFMHEANTSLVMWFEQDPALPGTITTQMLTEARMNFHRLPRNAGVVRCAIVSPSDADGHLEIAPSDVAAPVEAAPVETPPAEGEPAAVAPAPAEPAGAQVISEGEAPCDSLAVGERRLIEVMRVLPVDLQHRLAGYAEGLAGRQQGGT